MLEDLGRLRQRVEAALLEPARDDEIARALRRRLEQNRGLDVEELRRLHRPADHADHLRAQADVALEPRAAEVEPPVPEPQRLVDVLLVELERERGAARDDLERVHLELDLACRQLRVDRPRRAGDDLALGAEDELVPDLVHHGVRLERALGVDHELADPGAVAQVDEDEPAVVAPRVHPAGEDQALADVLGPHLAAAEVAPRLPGSGAGQAGTSAPL